MLDLLANTRNDAPLWWVGLLLEVLFGFAKCLKLRWMSWSPHGARWWADYGRLPPWKASWKSCLPFHYFLMASPHLELSEAHENLSFIPSLHRLNPTAANILTYLSQKGKQHGPIGRCWLTLSGNMGKVQSLRNTYCHVGGQIQGTEWLEAHIYFEHFQEWKILHVVVGSYTNLLSSFE